MIIIFVIRRNVYMNFRYTRITITLATYDQNERDIENRFHTLETHRELTYFVLIFRIYIEFCFIQDIIYRNDFGRDFEFMIYDLTFGEVISKKIL